MAKKKKPSGGEAAVKSALEKVERSRKNLDLNLKNLEKVLCKKFSNQGVTFNQQGGRFMPGVGGGRFGAEGGRFSEKGGRFES